MEEYIATTNIDIRINIGARISDPEEYITVTGTQFIPYDESLNRLLKAVDAFLKHKMPVSQLKSCFRAIKGK